MQLFLRKKGYNFLTNSEHLEPLTNTLNKETYNGKSDKKIVNILLRIYPTSSTSDLYQFKLSLFDHGNQKEFLLFICNLNMTIRATGTLEIDVMIQYLCKIVHGEELRQFDLLSADVANKGSLNLGYYIQGLALHFPTVNSISKQKRVMRRGIKIQCSLKVRRYTARLIDLNEYLNSFPVANLADKINVTKLNNII